jgi:hypothetical protein
MPDTGWSGCLILALPILPNLHDKSGGREAFAAALLVNALKIRGFGARAVLTLLLVGRVDRLSAAKGIGVRC